ncbi:MAG: DUF4097 domain-containing protein [Terriglobia bacterium]
MPSRSTLCLWLLAAALLLPTNLAAQRSQHRFPASAETLVEVGNQSGRVRVHGWAQPQVRVVAERHSRFTEVHFEQAANRLHIHTHVLQADIPASDRTVDYEIWMPAGGSLDLHLNAGEVEVEGLRGVVKIETVAASVLLRGLVGSQEVTTTSGDVTVINSGGRLKVSSVSGNLTFIDTPSRSLTARTASGNIRYEGDLRRGGFYEFSNHEGEIELLLPLDASFELTARSVYGDVVNAFPLRPKSHGRLPPLRYAGSLLGTVQSGAALVRADTFNGRITIRKR